jgi:poly(beta-D-mannuronate) lyase
MKEKKSKKGEGSEVNVAKYPPVQDLVLARNVSVNNTGADLEVGFAYKRHWPENQLVLLPENCQIKDNRFIRSTGGESVIGSLPDTQPPLDKIKLSPNHYENNLLFGGTCAYAPAKSGCKEESIPAGWSAEQELANWKVLRPEDVGPEWVVALRKAGQFAIEDDKSCYRAEPAKGEKKKKKKKKE